ncbi:pilin [Fusobacterium sp. CAG:439]|nr:pilin [Fusobacterium sp. CAG:439]
MSGQAAHLGFTLAEVLVTLGIIGVVSAMTVPSLMQNHQRKTYVTQLHKVYNEVQQASLQYMTDKNAINLREAGLTSRSAMLEFLTKYFKVVQQCEEGSVRTPCFAPSYKSIDGTDIGDVGSWGSAACITLASGAAIMIDYPSLYSSTVDNVKSYWGNMLIDINGAQGPNIAGRDLFQVVLYDDGSIDIEGVTPACRSQGICNGSSPKDIRNNLYSSKCKQTTASDGAIGCFGKILNDNWEMNY